MSVSILISNDCGWVRPIFLTVPHPTSPHHEPWFIVHPPTTFLRVGACNSWCDIRDPHIHRSQHLVGFHRFPILPIAGPVFVLTRIPDQPALGLLDWCGGQMLSLCYSVPLKLLGSCNAFFL